METVQMHSDPFTMEIVQKLGMDQICGEQQDVSGVMNINLEEMGILTTPSYWIEKQNKKWEEKRMKKNFLVVSGR